MALLLILILLAILGLLPLLLSVVGISAVLFVDMLLSWDFWMTMILGVADIVAVGVILSMLITFPRSIMPVLICAGLVVLFLVNRNQEPSNPRIVDTRTPEEREVAEQRRDSSGRTIVEELEAGADLVRGFLTDDLEAEIVRTESMLSNLQELVVRFDSPQYSTVPGVASLTMDVSTVISRTRTNITQARESIPDMWEMYNRMDAIELTETMTNSLREFRMMGEQAYGAANSALP